MGRITWQRVCFYYCKTCRRGLYPLNEALVLSDLGSCSAKGFRRGSVGRGGAAFCACRRELHGIDWVSFSPREAERLTEERVGTLKAYQERQRAQVLAGQEESTSGEGPTGPRVWAVAC